jgi:hypothetical protein
MTTFDYTLTLNDCEIIALENLLKYILETYSDDEGIRKNAVMGGVGKLPCETMLRKVKDRWKSASMTSTSSFVEQDPIILQFNRNK